MSDAATFDAAAACSKVIAVWNNTVSELDNQAVAAAPVPVTSHLQWGRPVEIIKQSSFTDEASFHEHVQYAKNHPGSLSQHRVYSTGGIYKCLHESVDGVACPHMVKVVFKSGGLSGMSVAEIYASGKHTQGALLFNPKLEHLTGNEISQALSALTGGSLTFPEQQQVVQQLLTRACDTSSKYAAGAVGVLTGLVMQEGFISSLGTLVAEFIEREVASLAASPVQSTSCTDAAVGALSVLYSLLVNCQQEIEPLAVSLLAPLLALQTDRNALGRAYASGCAQTLFSFLCPYSFFSVFPTLAIALGGIPGSYANIDWKTKVAALSLLTMFANGGQSSEAEAEAAAKAAAGAGSVPTNVHSTRAQAILQLSSLLPQIVPMISECMVDSKRQVSIAGMEAMQACCKAITNDDIRHMVPQLVNVIAKPDEAIVTLDKLMETTFVSNVDAPTLSLLAPLLVKALKGRSSVMKRKAGKVIINMCKLGQEASDVLLLITYVLAVLDKSIDEIVEFEVCEVLKEARNVMLLKAVGQINHAGESTNAIASGTGGESSEQMKAAMDAVAKQAKEAAMENKSSQNMEVPINKPLLSAMEKYLYDALLHVATTVDGAGSSAAAVDISTLSVNDKAPPVFVPGAASVLVSVLERARRYLARALALFVLTSSGTVAAVASAVERGVGIGLPTAAGTEQRKALAEIVAFSSLGEWNRCMSPYIHQCMGFEAGGVASVFTAATESAAGAASISSPIRVSYRARSNTGSRLSHNGGGRSRTNSTLSNHGGRPSVQSLCLNMRTVALQGEKDRSLAENSEDGDLCDIEFSLAFGGKILLHNAYLRLGKGRRYGLMGKNGAGKTTLLNNIASGHIEGLPETLRTCYVQHDNASDDFGVSMVDEMMSSPEIQDLTSEPVDSEFYITRKDAVNAFKSVGFTDEMLEAPRSSLSGGWKMKLLIIKAMLSKPDVLLLDEPTNHLDAASVAWLADYLMSAKDLTVLVVSHDTGFLDKIITDVIHYETLKLVYYKGNLSSFVELKPEAKYYYELEGDTLSFKFPLPERLDGVNSASKAVIQLRNASYTYPGCSSPQIIDANVKVSLSSRVACIGANGAGKSTLIKMIVQETEPDKVEGVFSEVYKHHNVRVAYVAQHSFHHVEQALDMSPVDYMKKRFHGGVDNEDFSRQNMKLTEEELDQRKDRAYGEVDEILGRRKNGRTMEYECTFVGQTHRDPNKYIAREKLEAMGLIKLVNAADTKIAAAAAGLAIRPLLTKEIQSHLDDFNLDAEFGTHGTIRRLSGGQKVKLVLAAAMWNRPHILILDEPTNYLDRQALGALTQAIKTFAGGVVIISHNSEFTDAVCNETWRVENHRVYQSGGDDAAAQAAAALAAADGATEEEIAARQADLDKANLKKSRREQKLADGAVSKREAKQRAGAASAANTGGDNIGCMNKTIISNELLNPKTLEVLSKKETRKLDKLAKAAGVSLEEYVGKLKFGCPEWNWL